MVGRTLALDGDPYVVLGILGPFDTEAIQSPAGPPDVWLPFQIDPNSAMQGHSFMAARRFKPDVMPALATAQLQVAATEFRQKFPDALGPQGGFGAQALKDVIVGNVRSSLLVLMGAVGFVLLIAVLGVPPGCALIRLRSRHESLISEARTGRASGKSR